MQNAKKNIRESTESNKVKINNQIKLYFQGKSPIIESFFVFASKLKFMNLFLYT